MANVKYSGSIAAISGSVGGATFSKTKTGAVLRQWTAPVATRSTKQAKAMVVSFNAQSAWKKLTQQQRNKWEYWAEFQVLTVGKYGTSAMSGQEAYMTVNTYRNKASLSILEDPIFTVFNLAPFSIELVRTGSNLDVVITTASSSSQYKPLIALSAPTPITRGYTQKAMVYVSYTNPASHTFRVTQDYKTTYGMVPTAGEILNTSIFLLQLSNGAFSLSLDQQLEVQ